MTPIQQKSALVRAESVSHQRSSATERTPKALLLSVFVFASALNGCSLLGPLISNAIPLASTKLMFSCIPEHTSVDTPDGPRPIEHLEAGDRVIGFSGKPVRILQKHAYLEDPGTVFLHIAFAGGSSVDLCGMHRVAGVRAHEIRVGQTIAGREVTRIESRRGETHSFDLLTEDTGYRIHGVPVNSMIEEMQKAATTGMRSVRP